MWAYLMWSIRALVFLLFSHDIPVAVFETSFHASFLAGRAKRMARELVIRPCQASRSAAILCTLRFSQPRTNL
jgi:hypothetical protein